MAFFQDAPTLGNQFDDDALLGEYMERVLPAEMRSAVEDEYRDLGAQSGGELYRWMLEDRVNEPVLTQWDPWGHRIDQIEVSPLWKRAQVLSAEHGLVGAGYEKEYGQYARVHQFLMNYLVQASLDIYSCPLAMTDGATRSLLDSGNQALIDRAVSRLTSRDPAVMWTSGQWMTERTGGSDVGLSETVAVEKNGQWRLYGDKWFTSATTSDMALTLARPEGNGPGGKGLALFYVELRDGDGRLRNISVNRLKDKFGTRKVPTAELTLDGTPATPVTELANGVRHITPMLNITRTWNSVAAAWGMRRGVALTRAYADKRAAFGDVLANKPLHIDTIAGMAAEADAGFHLAFRIVELLGKTEHGTASESEKHLFRALTPIAKLITAKQGVAVASETLEAFGGAGYVEDTGLPRLLADAQVLPIWEGTTNVLALDHLRALSKDGTFEALQGDFDRHLAAATDPSLAGPVGLARAALGHAIEWIGPALTDRSHLEAGARRFALTIGRSYQLAMMCAHAQDAMNSGSGDRARAAARRFADHGVDLITDTNLSDSKLLA